MKSSLSIPVSLLLFIVGLSLLLMPGSAAAMKVSALDRVTLSFVTARDGVRHEIDVIAFDHGVTAETDTASGLPTGKRQHKPSTITKATDNSSPVILQALLAGEVFTDWQLEVRRFSLQGSAQLTRSVTLEQPTVCGVRNIMTKKKLVEREHVAFCYQKIIWTFEDGGIALEDDWETSVGG